MIIFGGTSPNGGANSKPSPESIFRLADRAGKLAGLSASAFPGPDRDRAPSAGFGRDPAHFDRLRFVSAEP